MKIDPADLDLIRNYDLQHQCVVPRPVFLVSTISPTGVHNVAPFSYLAPLNFYPPTIGFSIMRRKGKKMDTLTNIEFSHDFVVNMVEEGLIEPMHKSAAPYPPDVSEFTEVGLTPVKSEKVKAPSVGESPLSIECTLLDIMEFGKMPNIASLVIGETVLYRIRNDLFVNGTMDLSKLRLIGVMGGDVHAASYCRIGEVFRMERPKFP